MITISLCMIVKNEEKNLRACLDSLKGVYDELLIADTGSTDRTKAVAEEYTSQIYDYEWTGDFSRARNFILEKAGCEYVYMADADERLDEDNRGRLLALKETLDTATDVVQMYYTNQMSFGTIYNFDRELRPKLFKRVKEIRYMEPIHEILDIQPVIFDSDIEIIHCPLEEHTTRDLAAFEKLIKQGKSLSKRLHNLYARELFVSGKDSDFLNALEFFERSANDTERTADEVKEACCVTARALRLMDNPLRFLKYAMRDIADNPSSEMCFELGEFYMEKEDYEEAIIWYYNAGYETQSILNLRRSTDEPRKQLACCYRKLGMEEQALQYEKEAMELQNRG